MYSGTFVSPINAKCSARCYNKPMRATCLKHRSRAKSQYETKNFVVSLIKNGKKAPLMCINVT